MPPQAVDARELLLERDAEQRALVDLLDRAERGTGGLIVIQGPAGIGKTRLLGALGPRVEERELVVGRARGGSLEQEVSFGVVRQLFEPLLAGARDPDALFTAGAAAAAPIFGQPVAGGGADDGGPGTVLHGLYWLTVALAEQRPPLVMFVDDAHWADGPSLRFLAYLANRIAELPIALVVASRPPEPGPEGELLERIQAFQDVRLMRLAPLTRDAVGQLVRRSLDDAVSAFCEAVADASNGNPFLVTELVRSARAAGDAGNPLGTGRLTSLSVEESVLARIGRLPAAGLDVARAVVVLGGDAHLRHVAALAGLSIDDAGSVADQLLRADILGPERPLTFVHPLVATAVYGTMLPGERSALHRRAVGALRAEKSPAERLAPHVMASDPAGDVEAVDVLSTSARSAIAQGATEVAIAQLRRALDEPPPPSRRLEIVLPLAIAESLMNDAGAIEHFGEAIERIPDARVRLTLATVRAATMSMAGRSEEAVASLQTLMADMPAEPDLRVQLLAGINIAGSIGPTPAPLMAANMAEFRAALAADADAPADVLAIRALVGGLSGEDAADVESMARRALAKIDEHDPMLPLWFHLTVAALTMVDRDDVADAAIERGLTPARRAGAPAQVSVMLFQRAVIAYRAGDLDDAEADSRASLEICAEHHLRYVLPAPLSVLIDVLRERDDLAGAQELLTAHGYDDRDGDCLFDHLLVFARARLRGAMGCSDDAVAGLQRAWDRARSAGCVSPGFVAWQANLADALVMSGRLREAAEQARSALAEANRLGLPRPRAEALRALALAEPDQGHERLTEAAATFASLGARLEEARTAAATAHVLLAGRTRPELDVLTQGLWLAEQCGAKRLAAHLRSELKALGVRAKVRPVAGPGALTASERRVAALAAAGRTNKEVAQELFVTVKTVETHLARAYQKLGIASRTELRQAMSA